MTLVNAIYGNVLAQGPYLTKIARDTMNFQSSLDWPEGGWQKAATTTALMEWLEEFLASDAVHEAVIANERFKLIFLATSSMNRALRLLYYGGAWLHRLEAAEISSLGLTFLRAYVKLAQICLAAKEPRFPIHSKHHMLFHTFHLMKCWAAKVQWQENPLVDSCQQDEAFVGVVSRYSRRVSPKATIERTLDVYFTSLKKHLRGEE